MPDASEAPRTGLGSQLVGAVLQSDDALAGLECLLGEGALVLGGHLHAEGGAGEAELLGLEGVMKSFKMQKKEHSLFMGCLSCCNGHEHSVSGEKRAKKTRITFKITLKAAVLRFQKQFSRTYKDCMLRDYTNASFHIHH